MLGRGGGAYFTNENTNRKNGCIMHDMYLVVY